MANDYVTRFRADTSQHDAAIKSSTQYVKSLDTSIKGAQVSIDRTTGSFSRFKNKANGVASSLANLGFDKLKGSLGGFGDLLVRNVGGSLGKVSVAGAGASASIAGLSAAASAALPALAALAASVAVIKKSMQFEVNLDNFQALTGLGDKEMKGVADMAIGMSQRFGVAAGDIVDSMALIGSQFPKLLEDSKALGEVAEAANVLSIAAGIDMTQAAKGITTVLNQMGVSAGEANNIINVLAAGSQQGAAEIDYLNQALEKSGTAFSSANVSYVEAIAAIEAIAPKFSSADVAGSQLASTLLRLSTQANDNFKPAVVGMSQALENLAAAELTDLELKNLVGESNITIVKSLIDARDTYDDLTESLKGTNTAFEQMATKTDNLPSLLKKLKNSWDAMLLKLGQTETFQIIQESLKTITRGLTNMVTGLGNFLAPLLNIVGNLVRPLQTFISSFSLIQVLVKNAEKTFSNLTKTLNFLSAIVEEVTSVSVFFINKISKGLKTLWTNMKNVLTDTAVFKWFKSGLEKVLGWFDKFTTKIKQKWAEFKNWIGVETISELDVSATDEELEFKGKIEIEDVSFESPDLGGSPNSNIIPDKVLIPNTIDWYSEKIKEINDELQGTIVSESRLAELQKQKAEYTEKQLELQKRYGFVTEKPNLESPLNDNAVFVNPNSYKGISEALDNLNNQLDLEIHGSEKYWSLVKSIKELTEKKMVIELEMEKDLLTDSEKRILRINDSIDRTEKMGDDLSSVMNSLGTTFSAFGKNGETANQKIAQTIGVVSNAMAEMIPHIITLITAKQAEALSSGTASAAKLPYPANIPAILSIVATLGTVFAQIPTFANGGIIKGATTIGDYNLARVNSGEMILNGSQQAKLFNLVNSGDSKTNFSGDVEFKLRGDMLIGLLKNTEKKKGRVG